jgi:hypothetical protein
MPEDALGIIDQGARHLNLSRSAFLAEAALNFLEAKCLKIKS